MTEIRRISRLDILVEQLFKSLFLCVIGPESLSLIDPNEHKLGLDLETETFTVEGTGAYAGITRIEKNEQSVFILLKLQITYFFIRVRIVRRTKVVE